MSLADMFFPIWVGRQCAEFRNHERIDVYADTFVRWLLAPGRGEPGAGERFWTALLREADWQGWYIALIANTDDMAEKYRRWGMDWDNENDQESRRLVYDGRAKAQSE